MRWKIASLFCALAVGLGRMAAADGLREAARRGDSAEVVRLLDAVPADQRALVGTDALVWSAFYGQSGLLDALLKRGVAANAPDARGWTALLAAVKGDRPEVVGILLAHGADANARPADGSSSAATLAAELGRTAIADIFRQRQPPGPRTAPDAKAAERSLLAAEQNGRPDVIRTLLADPAFRVGGISGQVALVLAIRQGDAATVTALLDRGASASAAADRAGLTPLIAATLMEDADLARLLLDRGADANGAGGLGITALQMAVGVKAEKVAFLLLAHGAKVPRISGGGDSLLVSAIKQDLPSLVEPLLAGGADIDGADPEGVTPLMHAVRSCHAAVDLLLAHHPRLDLRDHEGRGVFDLPDGPWLADKMRRAGAAAQVEAVAAAPRRDRAQLADALLAAVKTGDTPAVKTLLEQGADPLTCNKLGWPVSVLAATRGYTEIIRLLFERDRNCLYAQSAPGGWNAMLEAAGNNHLETVRYLLACQVPPEWGNEFGRTPLDCAERRHYPEVADLLREALAKSPTRFAPPVPR